MIRATYRYLENHVRIGPLGLVQWLQLIVAAALLYGLVALLSIPTRWAISMAVFIIGVPATIAAASDEFDFSFGRQIQDAFGWRFRAREFTPDAQPAVLRFHIVKEKEP